MSLEPISLRVSVDWIEYWKLRESLRCRMCTLANQISPVNILSNRLQEQIRLMGKKKQWTHPFVGRGTTGCSGANPVEGELDSFPDYVLSKYV